jgi:ABC-type Fe3+ transport system permease subunit
MENLSFVGALLFTALGVVASIMIPVLRAAAPRPPEGGALANKSFGQRFWAVLTPYLALGALSLLVAILIMAIAEQTDKPFRSWWEALLAGYVSDSTLEKFRTPAS